MAKKKQIIGISKPYIELYTYTADLVSGCSIIDEPQGMFFGRNKMTNFKISLPPPFVAVVDIGPLVDTGPVVDAVPFVDIGPDVDTGPVVDIGPVVDTGPVVDAGPVVDFDFPPEKITAIGITILEIIITETQAIMTITTFPDKNSMVTDIMPKYLSIHVNLILVPSLNSNYYVFCSINSGTNLGINVS